MTSLIAKVNLLYIEYQQTAPPEFKNTPKTDRGRHISAFSTAETQKPEKRSEKLNESRTSPPLLNFIMSDESDNTHRGSDSQSPDEKSKIKPGDSKESGKATKLPSYLAPTTAALMYKSQKYELDTEKPRFSFGRSKKKFTGFLDWSPRNAAATMEKSPKGILASEKAAT